MPKSIWRSLNLNRTVSSLILCQQGFIPAAPSAGFPFMLLPLYRIVSWRRWSWPLRSAPHLSGNNSSSSVPWRVHMDTEVSRAQMLSRCERFGICERYVRLVNAVVTLILTGLGIRSLVLGANHSLLTKWVKRLSLFLKERIALFSLFVRATRMNCFRCSF